MKDLYITTDLEFDAPVELGGIVEELGDNVSVHLNQWDVKMFRVALGSVWPDQATPAESIEAWCELIEGLSAESQALWTKCTRRVVDIAFEGGAENITHQLPSPLVERMSKLGLSIAITIYEPGTYSDEGGGS